MDRTEIAHLVDALLRFRGAFERWLETQHVRADHSRSGLRATVSPLPNYDPADIAVRFAQVQELEDDADRGMRLAAIVMPIYQNPGLTAARSWVGMSLAGTRTNPGDVLSDSNRAAATLMHVLARADRGLAPFPVPDPTELHPYVWDSQVISAWIQEKYDRIPLEIAYGVRYAWARRLDMDFKNDSRAWAQILSEISARSLKAQLQIPARAEEQSESMADIQSTLLHLEGRARSDSSSGAVHEGDVGEWLEKWSDAVATLERNAPAAAANPPRTRSDDGPAHPKTPPGLLGPSELERVTVDVDVFAPVPHPDVPDVFIRANEVAVVESVDPQGRVAEALVAAARRLQLVDESGTEHADHDSLVDDAADLHTPSWASVLDGDDSLTRLYVDCEGVITTEMGEAMRRILQEELARHLSGAHVSSGWNSRQ